MATENFNLNLARKWRSRTFDTIVGQDLPIKMLKNSLFLDQYFPVYLFAGQRGCGKTSTARVFAAAVNCERLSEFQKDPRQCSLPCQTCFSCQAMLSGTHPDFMEIDAASHTGVDNVRMIIESSSLLPLLGRKKLYLIDEAHMLSKSAFNAFLKMMEEPPKSVLFMLATTDAQKILDTVRSRCFQLFFKPVDTSALVAHLRTVCDAEGIAYDDEGLSCIVKETAGSVRDALNVVEQVRFSATSITTDAVFKVLGYVDDARLLQLFETVLHKDQVALLRVVQELELHTFSAEALCKRLIEVIRAALWMKHGVRPSAFESHIEHIGFLIRSVPAARLQHMLELLYRHEQQVAKSTAAYPLLELLLLQLCNKNENNSNSNVPVSMAPAVATEEAFLEADSEDEDAEEDDTISDDQARANSSWNVFVMAVAQLDDPLLTSVFKQGKVVSWDTSTMNLTVSFAKEFVFFQDWMNSSEQTWRPLLKTVFGEHVIFIPEFTADKVTQVKPPVIHQAPVITKQEPVQTQVKKTFTPYQNGSSYKPRSVPIQIREPKLDISDSEKFKTVHMVLKYFPGTVTEMRESL